MNRLLKYGDHFWHLTKEKGPTGKASEGWGGNKVTCVNSIHMPKLCHFASKTASGAGSLVLRAPIPFPRFPVFRFSFFHFPQIKISWKTEPKITISLSVCLDSSCSFLFSLCPNLGAPKTAQYPTVTTLFYKSKSDV